MLVRILKNARIYTGCAASPWVQVAAIVDGRIAALDREALGWAAAPGAVEEDLEGATVIPGLIDAHIHLMWYALSLPEIELRGCSRAELLERVAARAVSLSPGCWIKGRGWDQNIWPDSAFPTAAELDRVAPAHPVALIAKNAHAVVANSAAMRIAGITAEMADPPYGKIGRDAAGVPNGMFFEEAARLIYRAAPPPSLPEMVGLLDEAQYHLLRRGITAVHDVDGNPAFAAFQELRRQGRQRIRVVKYVRLEAFEALLASGLRTGMGDDLLQFGGLKLFVDGALGARTAAMDAPYEGEPDNVGILTLEPEQLCDIVERAAAAGIAAAIHAIGDRANRLVLDALEAALPRNPALRHRVEHVQLINPEDCARLGRLNLVASMQPIHAVHDMQMSEQYWGARSCYAYAWRSVADAGAPLAFGSDAPIEVFDPFLGLYAAVTRRSESDGAPGPEGWYPAQRLSLTEALRAYTWGGAYAAGQENRLGLLLPGYYADLAVLNQNIFAMAPAALLQTTVQRVMLAGQWVDI